MNAPSDGSAADASPPPPPPAAAGPVRDDYIDVLPPSSVPLSPSSSSSSSTADDDGATTTTAMTATAATTTTATTSRPRHVDPLEIGDRCRVLWRDGTTLLLASVVERKDDPAAAAAGGDPGQGGGGGTGRGAASSVVPAPSSTAAADDVVVVDGAAGEGPVPKKSRTNDDTAGSTSSSSSPAAWNYLYYVHYEEHDRRLDEWVPLSRFDLSTLRRLDDHGAEGLGVGGGSAGGSSSPIIGGTTAGGMEADGTSAVGVGSVGRGRPGRRSSDGKFGPSSDGGTGRGRRGRPALRSGRSPSSSSSAATTATTADHPTAADGRDDGDGHGHGSSDSILRGGNWHGSSGNPDLAELEAEHHEITKVKNITQIVMGNHLVEAWYYSPFPPPYHQVETMYICEFCLKYMRKPQYFMKHRAECPHRCPPGDEIYREGRLSVFELDGKDHRVYCQNLCLLAKLFLDHKTLYYDVDPFYFYVITEVDDGGAHIVGYFSKEKVSAEDYNLACILTFPQYQKCGYGKFIISLSYELSKREGKPGSPEKPLSDLGKISYRSYWTHVLLTLFSEQTGEENVQIKDISLMTGIKTEDIISTLQSLNMIRFWKGQHVVFVMQDFLKKYMAQKKKIRLCDGRCLAWTPHAERKKGVGSGGD
ncbi:hypothetical protein ACHAW5_002461 [Stephanodiscus triporus]|uniref:Histone acetyltransferase n=1 Tax=Stephanodiscus triporus TaxID=2934178 RepID=A0ABD3PSM2_9STRA